MHLRIINLDDALTLQSDFVRRNAPEILDFTSWGPSVRLACGFGRFRRFEKALADATADAGPCLSFIGSGDFHHVTLALLRRQAQPFNLLVIDKHPDWMRWIPAMHCGTWLRHALLMPQLRRVFHVGGDLDFDNLYRMLAPWRDLQSGRLKVVPAQRRFRRGRWASLPQRPLQQPGEFGAPNQSLREALNAADRDDLARWPLYISLDKDVMSAGEAVVNWDSGALAWAEVREILDYFFEASQGRIVGADVVGDWSAVHMRTALGALCHWTEHPRLAIDPEQATRINQSMNQSIAEMMADWTARLVPDRHSGGMASCSIA